MVRTGIVPNPFLCLPAFCWLGFCFVCVLLLLGFCFVCVCCLFVWDRILLYSSGWLKLPPRTRTHRSLPVSASQVWVTTPGGDCKVCLFNYICLFIECIGWAGTCSDAYVEVGQPIEVSSLLPCGSRVLNSGCQPWQPALLPAESSYWSLILLSLQ